MQTTMFRSGGSVPQDRVAQLLLQISQNTLVIVLGLFPLLFVPISYAPFNYSKLLFVIVGVVVAIIFFSLSVLRRGSFSIAAPLGLLFLWGVVGAYALSTLFSGDVNDALIGNAFEVHTTSFILLLAVIASAATILRGSKVAIVRLYGLFIASGVVLALFHLARIFFGVDALSFGTFTSLTASPLGSWNGLALYFGLVLLIALVALEQLPLTRIGKAVLGVSSTLSLVMLMIVNYRAVWMVLAAVSLVVLIYSLTRTHYRVAEPTMIKSEPDQSSFASAIFATIVFVISVVFILGGSSLGTAIGNYTDVSFVEVRPSFSATLDIARNVYNEDPIFGIGPNKFADAWRQHKNPAINQSIFWNTNFEAGSGYIPTSFITTGVVGVVAWAIFFIFLLIHGFTMFFRASHADRFWNFIGSSAFVAAVYLWGMSLIYTPSPAILVLTAVCTGVFFAAYTVLVPQREWTISVAANRAFGFVLVGIVVLVIFGSVGTLYATGQHYSSLYTFNRAFATLGEEDTLDTLQERIAVAYDRFQNDVFARQIAQYRLAQINSLLALEEPTSEQQQQFQDAVAGGVNAAQVATEIDPSESLNWQVLGQLYSALTLAGVEGAHDRAKEAYARARELAPHNPSLALLEAQLASRDNDLQEAKALAEEAVAMKRNYTEALLFLSQIDILNNDVEAAIARTESIISIEPQNPARYYQLGILESAAGNDTRAIAAFERAVALDNDYANARYFLALGYANQGRTDAALEQLQVVARLNPENQEIRQMIERVENGEPIVDPEEAASRQTDEAVLEDGEAVTRSAIEETSLVSPVNVVPEDEQATSTAETTTGAE